jgi:hypothetical protein
MLNNQSASSPTTTNKPSVFKARLALVIILGAGGLALSPAAAKAVGVIVESITSCSSSSACIGGSNSGNGPGVGGTAKKSSGVIGTSSASQAANYTIAGVYGNNTATSQGGIGVLGRGAYGVYGEGATYSIYGYLPSSTKTGYGVVGNDASAYGGIGVYAHSNNGNAANLQQSAGDALDTVDIIGGLDFGATPLQDLIVVLTNDNNYAMRLDNSGNMSVYGEIYTNGSCYSGCVKSKVRSYAPHESVPTMEDVGEAKLVAGSAEVALDRAFANVIDTNASYAVLITPEGDSNGLYVAQRTSRGFVVRENRAGRSSLTFSYRIVAKPFGNTNPRLPMVANIAPRSAKLPTLGSLAH